jgi:hypothetical protein
MRYIPPTNIIQSQKELRSEAKQKISDIVDNVYNLPRNPISDTTNFIVTSTTIDVQKIDDKRFKARNELLIMAIDKFSALSNLNPSDQTLTTLIWQDMIYAIKFGYDGRAERKALELIRVYNESRGRGGEFSRQLITTREELIAKHKMEETERQKKGLLGFMYKKPQPSEESEQKQ